MSIIKTFHTNGSHGDMFYIIHGSSNFSIIDCCLCDENKEEIVEEILRKQRDKDINRFISTHPDEDHIQLLDYLDDKINIRNFYCVKNLAIKKGVETDGFKRYKQLRDSEDKVFYIYRGCSRKWMNENGEDKNGKYIGSAGISVLWPITDNEDYKNELDNAKKGVSFNNISSIIKYTIENSATTIWMGDLETDFMNKICDKIDLPKTNILFAPHHGRKSGKIPNKWIKQLDPDLIVMGEANSNDSDYSSYPEYNIIRQNTAKDIRFECIEKKIHIFSSNKNFSPSFLVDEGYASTEEDTYIGSITIE